MSGLDAVLTDAAVIVCCGSGGVGKTTTAAVIGMHLARQGRRVIVLTIDPAKRLADALGMPGELGNEPVRLPVDADGQLWAAMLDPAATFDGIVRDTARSATQAEAILGNRFYRNITHGLSGTQEYMAAERLLALHADGRFDVVVVDTPPSRQALDFLDAPEVLTRFLDHPVFRVMMLPARRGLGVVNIAAQPVLRSIGKVVGGEVLADAIEFFHGFEGMEGGFRQRATTVTRLLTASDTRFVLVASPRQDTIDEARFLAARLRESSRPVTAVVINRATPRFGRTAVGRRRADAALRQNLAELVALADAELAHARALIDDAGDAPVVWVPSLSADVHDLAGLDLVRHALFGVEHAGG